MDSQNAGWGKNILENPNAQLHHPTVDVVETLEFESGCNTLQLLIVYDYHWTPEVGMSFPHLNIRVYDRGTGASLVRDDRFRPTELTEKHYLVISEAAEVVRKIKQELGLP